MSRIKGVKREMSVELENLWKECYFVYTGVNGKWGFV